MSTTYHPRSTSMSRNEMRSKSVMAAFLLESSDFKIGEENSALNNRKVNSIPLKSGITDFGNYFQPLGRRIHAIDIR